MKLAIITVIAFVFSIIGFSSMNFVSAYQSSEPTPEIILQLIPEPAPEPIPDPTPKLIPEPIPDPAPKLIPEPIPDPAPKLIPEPIFIDSDKTEMPVQVAMSYNTSFTEIVVSYVNNINTIEGGTHVAGFRRALTRTLKSYAEKSGLLEKAKVEISGDDFREGITTVISVKVAEPQFEGQTKTKLGNSEVMGAVDTSVGEMLSNYLEENPREASFVFVCSS